MHRILRWNIFIIQYTTLNSDIHDQPSHFYTTINCSELQMLMSTADCILFLDQTKCLKSPPWVLISGCGSFAICLMLSYFFSLSSYLTDNILNLIRTLSPTPTYTSWKTISFYYNHSNLDLTSLATKENWVWPTHIMVLFMTDYFKAIISTHTKNMDVMVTPLQTSH